MITFQSREHNFLWMYSLSLECTGECAGKLCTSENWGTRGVWDSLHRGQGLFGCYSVIFTLYSYLHIIYSVWWQKSVFTTARRDHVLTIVMEDLGKEVKKRTC